LPKIPRFLSDGTEGLDSAWNERWFLWDVYPVSGGIRTLELMKFRAASPPIKGEPRGIQPGRGKKKEGAEAPSRVQLCYP
jgi:hypothetical protein